MRRALAVTVSSLALRLPALMAKGMLMPSPPPPPPTSSSSGSSSGSSGSALAAAKSRSSDTSSEVAALADAAAAAEKAAATAAAAEVEIEVYLLRCKVVPLVQAAAEDPAWQVRGMMRALLRCTDTEMVPRCASRIHNQLLNFHFLLSLVFPVFHLSLTFISVYSHAYLSLFPYPNIIIQVREAVAHHVGILTQSFGLKWADLLSDLLQNLMGDADLRVKCAAVRNHFLESRIIAFKNANARTHGHDCT